MYCIQYRKEKKQELGRICAIKGCGEEFHGKKDKVPPYYIAMVKLGKQKVIYKDQEVEKNVTLEDISLKRWLYWHPEKKMFVANEMPVKTLIDYGPDNDLLTATYEDWKPE